jgi:hypothetical protein
VKRACQCPARRKTVQARILAYARVGFARSLLAFELHDGRLKLIDGHLRRDLDPDMLVDVEILDVTDDEARKLLLTIDPLAALAQTQARSTTACASPSTMPRLRRSGKRGPEARGSRARVVARHQGD